ncbi:uncharacterized protein LOC122559483 [Chiloscyllium plagiosum]|uniref:uncharacterized protein LOC122559483 n=1 Tax=Chiloscyllium plagiosum TaxID=36176 RepID=UPI001CB86FBE|nr:uncharacterized protein LOC122559483 [Chiloscyllium plagiosum]
MNRCDPNAECLNSEGSYSCECNPYYRGNGTHCEGCFCPPEIIPGTANQPAVSGHPCPCVSGFITSNNFPSLYQNSADMYWFFNMSQLSNATRQYTGIRFWVESLSVESQEDYISFGCGIDPDQQKQFTLTEKNLNITTFHLSDCTDSWVHFHSGPNVPSTRFKIYYEMVPRLCLNLSCDVNAVCHRDSAGSLVCSCKPGWRRSGPRCYELRNMVQAVTASVTGPNVTLRWTVVPIPRTEILNYQVNTNCTNHTNGIIQLQTHQPGNTTSLVFTGLGSLLLCTTVIQVNTTSDGLVTTQPFTFKTYSETIPESLSLTSITTTSAVISWAPIGSVSALRACSLHYYSVGSPDTVHTVSFTLTSTEAVITGLKPDTTYTVSIVCHSLFNRTLSSQHLNVTTLPSLRFIINVYASHITSSTAVIGWDLHPSKAALIWSYSISYGPYARGGPTRNIIAFPPITTVILTDLNQSTVYIVTVSAKTLFGKEDTGSTLKFMTQSFTVPSNKTPAAPQQVRVGEFESYCVLVSWKPPSASPNETIQYNVNVQVPDSSPVRYTTNANYIYLRDLPQKPTYNITVSAVNRQGEGSPSKKVSLRMLQKQQPTPVQKLKPRLLINEAVSIRASSIILRLPECGMFDTAARQLDASYGRLSLYIVVAENEVAYRNFTLLSLNSISGVSNQSDPGQQSPYVAQQHLSVYDCDDGKNLDLSKTLLYYVVGSNSTCHSLVVCDKPLHSNTTYRIKYLLVDQHRGEIMSSNWSDKFHTKQAIPYQMLEEDWHRSAGMIIITVLSMVFLSLLLLGLLFVWCYRRKRTGMMKNNWMGYDTHFKKDKCKKNILTAMLEGQQNEKVNNTLFFIQPEDQRSNEDNTSRSWNIPEYHSIYGQRGPSIAHGLRSDHLLFSSASTPSDTSRSVQKSGLVHAGCVQNRLIQSGSLLTGSTQTQSAQSGASQTQWTANGLVHTGLAHTVLAPGCIQTGFMQNRSVQAGSAQMASVQKGSAGSGVVQDGLLLTRLTQQTGTGTAKSAYSSKSATSFAQIHTGQTSTVQNRMVQNRLVQTDPVWNESFQTGTMKSASRFSDASSLVESIRSRSSTNFLQSTMSSRYSTGLTLANPVQTGTVQNRMVQSRLVQTDPVWNESLQTGTLQSVSRFSDTSSLVESIRSRSSSGFLPSVNR